MKPWRQINAKYKQLVDKFRKERAFNCHENMGNKYMREFDQFIVDIYGYEYSTRMKIISLQNQLFEIVTS